jgi:fermentation-respiration switch protein FrsA (DUF1100 family)
MMDEIVGIVQQFVFISGSIVLCACVFLYFMQNKMIYLPNPPSIDSQSPNTNPPSYRNPRERGLEYQDVWLLTDDQVKVHAWLVKHSRYAPTVIFFTENAANMGFRLDSVQQFVQELQFNVFILSYRGYGNSEGSPTEEGLQADVRAAVKFVFEEASVDRTKVFLFGRSLGGAAAIYAASQLHDFKFSGVIVENTFTSIDELVDHLMPKISWLKALVLRNHWRSIARIQAITCPIMFISGRLDELVPASHMDRLYNAATSATFKDFRSVAQGNHNMTWRQAGEHYTEWFREFIRRCSST